MWIGDASAYFDKKDMNGQYRAPGDLSDYFTYQFVDQYGKMSNWVRTTLNVNCINDAPVANDDEYYGVENSTIDASIYPDVPVINDSDVDNQIVSG